MRVRPYPYFLVSGSSHPSVLPKAIEDFSTTAFSEILHSQKNKTLNNPTSFPNQLEVMCFVLSYSARNSFMLAKIASSTD